MEKLLVAIVVGIGAGIIDVIPMMLQKLDRHACVSAFIHWVSMGVIIAYVQVPLAPWLKGLLIAELSALAVVVMVAKNDKKAIVPIVVMSAILGVLVGMATAKYAV